MQVNATSQANPSNSSRWTHRVAWMLCGVTFPLLWVGGLVTTTKAGMAVPDWPGTYGFNLFLYPWQSWLFGPWDLFIEHGHRLLGSLAGLLTILLAVLLWRHDDRRWMRAVGVIAVGAVIAQGLLGGMRVVLSDRVLAMVHGSTGPLFFALTVAMVAWTSQAWRSAEAKRPATRGKLVSLALAATLVVYVQMIAGAVVRHMLVTATPQSFRSAVVVHMVLAGVVLLAALEVAWAATRRHQQATVRIAGVAVAGVVLLQISLGVATWLLKYGTPVWAEGILGAPKSALIADGWWQTHLITAHQATGSLLLAAMLSSFLWVWRMPSSVAATQQMDALPNKPSRLAGAAT